MKRLIILGMSIVLAGANVRAASSEDIYPLHAAAKRDDVVEVERLIDDVGIGVNSTDNHNCTALQIAAFKGYAATTRVLLDRGAKPNACDARPLADGSPGIAGGTPALHFAILGNHLGVANYLLRHKADINAVEPKHGYTPLHVAVNVGNPAIVDFLVRQKGIFLDPIEPQANRTPLCIAAQDGKVNIVEILLESGAKKGIGEIIFFAEAICRYIDKGPECGADLIRIRKGLFSPLSGDDKAKFNPENLGNYQKIVALLNSYKVIYEAHHIVTDDGDSKPLFIGECFVCHTKEVSLKCSRCHAVVYCSQTCQKADWKTHKTTCK